MDREGVFRCAPGVRKDESEDSRTFTVGFPESREGCFVCFINVCPVKKFAQVMSPPLPVSRRARGHSLAASTPFCDVSGALFPTPDSSSPAGLHTSRDAPLYMATKTHTTFGYKVICPFLCHMGQWVYLMTLCWKINQSDEWSFELQIFATKKLPLFPLSHSKETSPATPK